LTADVAQSHEQLIRAGIAGVTKRVHLSALAPQVVDSTVIIAIRWDSVGLTGELFPSLDADLKLRRSGQNQTLLTLTGSYRPPFGRVGATLDRLLLHQVAEATIRQFLRQLAEIATAPATIPLVSTSEAAATARPLTPHTEPGPDPSPA
jgi:hypothetical protein